MIIPVAVQSCRLIPALLLPPADPAGAKPRRDHRCLARVSRHEVPKTAGKRTPVKIYDPARVSRDYLRCLIHGSSGLRPSTTWLKTGHHKGCFVPHSSQLDEWLRCLSNATPLCHDAKEPCPRPPLQQTDSNPDNPLRSRRKTITDNREI